MKEPAEHLSSLEYYLNFRDPSFRAYMQVDSRRMSPTDLADWGEHMAEHKHPLVRYAAGWTAVELALYRRSTSHESLAGREGRLATLQIARERWASAGRGMPDLAARQSTPELQANIRGMEYRLTQALACLPVMEVGASLMAHDPFPQEVVDQKIQATRERATLLAQALRTLQPKGRAMQKLRRGLMSELVFGLVAQSDDPRAYIFMPSSIRQDHNPRRRLRADFVAMNVEPPHRRQLIQTKFSERSDEEEKRFHVSDHRRSIALEVIAKRDLTLDPRQNVFSTAAIFEKLMAGTAEPESASSIHVLGRVVTLRLQQLEADRDQNPEMYTA